MKSETNRNAGLSTFHHGIGIRINMSNTKCHLQGQTSMGKLSLMYEVFIIVSNMFFFFKKKINLQLF